MGWYMNKQGVSSFLTRFICPFVHRHFFCYLVVKLQLASALHVLASGIPRSLGMIYSARGPAYVRVQIFPILLLHTLLLSSIKSVLFFLLYLHLYPTSSYLFFCSQPSSSWCVCAPFSSMFAPG